MVNVWFALIGRNEVACGGVGKACSTQDQILLEKLAQIARGIDPRGQFIPADSVQCASTECGRIALMESLWIERCIFQHDTSLSPLSSSFGKTAIYRELGQLNSFCPPR